NSGARVVVLTAAREQVSEARNAQLRALVRSTLDFPLALHVMGHKATTVLPHGFDARCCSDCIRVVSQRLRAVRRVYVAVVALRSLAGRRCQEGVTGQMSLAEECLHSMSASEH